jgi:hypothetical protein
MVEIVAALSGSKILPAEASPTDGRQHDSQARLRSFHRMGEPSSASIDGAILPAWFDAKTHPFAAISPLLHISVTSFNHLHSPGKSMFDELSGEKTGHRQLFRVIASPF